MTHGWVDEGRIAGVVTLVARHGRVVHLDAYGMADIEDRAPTITDVFRHTAGFSYGNGPAPVQNLYRSANLYSSESLEELTDKLAQIPLIYQPGSQWVYSFSRDVQARLVEVLSGMPFETFLRRRIFEPLGIEDMVFGIPGGLADRLADTYSPNERGRPEASDTAENMIQRQGPGGGNMSARFETMVYQAIVD